MKSELEFKASDDIDTTIIGRKFEDFETIDEVFETFIRFLRAMTFSEEIIKSEFDRISKEGIE